MNGADRFFVDSNILLYAHDARNKESSIALNSGSSAFGSTRRCSKCQYLLRVIEGRQPVVRMAPAREVSLALMERAWFWTGHARLSFWGALIVSAAERSGCRWLLSEDFQTGRQFGAITVDKPFERVPGQDAASGPE